MRRHRVPAWVALAVFCLFPVAALACGDDDDPAPSGDDGESTPTATVSDDGPPSSCAMTPYTVALRAASGDTVAVDNEAFEVASARAIRIADGAAYTIYLADFDIGDISEFSAPSPPEGRTLVTIFLTTFNAEDQPEIVEPGSTIEYTPDFGVLTFRVVPQVGAEQFGSFVSAEGTVDIDEAGDFICGTIRYTDSSSDTVSDDQNRLEGTFSAEVVE